MIEKIKEHPLAILVSVAAVCVASTWAVFQSTQGNLLKERVSDREREIAQLKEKQSEIEKAIQEFERRCGKNTAYVLPPQRVIAIFK